MPKCEICEDTGYYRLGRSHKRCECGAEPKKVPEGCDAFVIDADSKAAEELRKRVWHSPPPWPTIDRLPAHVATKVSELLCDCGTRFVLCWEEGGDLHTIHGKDGVAFSGPEGGLSPETDKAISLERAANNLRRTLFEFGEMKMTSLPQNMDDDTLEAAQSDEVCSREYISTNNLATEMFEHIKKMLTLHRKSVQSRDEHAASKSSKRKKS